MIDYVELADLICRRITRILNDRNMSMRSLSFRIEKSGDYIQKLLGGEIKELKLSVLIAICNELHISFFTLIFAPQNMPVQYYTLLSILPDLTTDELDAIIHMATIIKRNK